MTNTKLSAAQVAAIQGLARDGARFPMWKMTPATRTSLVARGLARWQEVRGANGAARFLVLTDTGMSVVAKDRTQP